MGVATAWCSKSDFFEDFVHFPHRLRFVFLLRLFPHSYAWVAPSLLDISNGFGADNVAKLEKHVSGYEELAESVSHRAPPHMLHKLLTVSAEDQGAQIHTNASTVMRDSNRNCVFIGSPTISPEGVRSSSFSAVVEPLWRENFANLDILTEREVGKVLFEGESGSRPVAVGVETADGMRYCAGEVVLATGCLETPAVLMRSGIGPGEHLRSVGISNVRVDNPQVGAGLRDKMLLDDMMLTDCTLGDFDKGLMLINRVFSDGVSVQLHRYDKTTIGNSYLALQRLARGSLEARSIAAIKDGLAAAAAFVDPRGFQALCFQTYFKMKSHATIRLHAAGGQRGKKMLSSSLDASALFEEAKQGEAHFRERTREVYEEILAMSAQADGRIKLKPCVPGIAEQPAEHMRLVWHFAGSCGVGLGGSAMESVYIALFCAHATEQSNSTRLAVSSIQVTFPYWEHVDFTSQMSARASRRQMEERWRWHTSQDI